MNDTSQPSNIDYELENGPGFYLGLNFQTDELAIVRDLIEKQWLDSLKEIVPESWQQFSGGGLEEYHKHAHLLNHAACWPKKSRILPQNAIDIIRATSLFKKLAEIYGPFEISDEEAVGREEIYWRLVRPQQVSDVGPLHADAWFWDLGHGKMPTNVKKRVKVWVALYCEPGLNGLRLVPESHKREWQYCGVYRDGFSKPQIDEKEEDLAITLAYTKPGDVIVFHDKLLHGGAVNQGDSTRVSMEFTVFIRN